MLTVLLAVGVSLCCCQMQVMWPSALVGTSLCASAGASSCCGGETTGLGKSELPASPDNGSCACCLKATNVNDGGGSLATVPANVLLAAPVWTALDAPGIADTIASTRLIQLMARPPSPTLLRQRCALII